MGVALRVREVRARLSKRDFAFIRRPFPCFPHFSLLGPPASAPDRSDARGRALSSSTGCKVTRVVACKRDGSTLAGRTAPRRAPRGPRLVRDAHEPAVARWLLATRLRRRRRCTTQSASAALVPPPAADAGATARIERRLVSKIAEVGPLGAPDANGVRLPAGFRARVIARTREHVVAGKEYVWHASPDGGATFETEDGGWIYVSNSEETRGGGAGAVRFDRTGAIVDGYAILSNTSTNCAGGPTPWSTWLSCEEIAKGQVHECDPRGERSAIVRPALGTFKHEAVTINPLRHHVYLTEDEPDGCFYRFVPDALGTHGFADLSAGRLEVAVVENGAVTSASGPRPTLPEVDADALPGPRGHALQRRRGHLVA